MVFARTGLGGADKGEVPVVAQVPTNAPAAAPTDPAEIPTAVPVLAVASSPTPTQTPISTPTHTPTPTPTPTLTAIATFTPIDTAIPTPTPDPALVADILNQPWRQSLSEASVHEVAWLVLSADQSTMFVGGRELELYRSSDEGQTWESLDYPDHQDGSVCRVKLAFHPGDTDVSYAYCQSGLWRSSNGGNSWTELQPPERGLNVIAVSTDLLYAWVVVESAIESLFRSNDHGETWREISRQASYYTQDAQVATRSASTLYVYGSSRVEDVKPEIRISTDGGFSWTPVADAPSGWQTLSPYFIVLSADPPSIYAAFYGDVEDTYQGILFKINALAPQEWLPPQLPSEAKRVETFAIHPANSDVLAVRNSGQLFFTDDAGASWVPLHEGGHLIDNVTHIGLPAYGDPRPLVMTGGSTPTICIGSYTGVWCHRAGL